MAEEKKLFGQILDVAPASRGIILESDRELAKARELLFRSWVRESAELNRPIRNLAGELVSQIESSTSLDGTRILARERQKLERLTRRTIDRAVDRMTRDIERDVSRAVARAQRAQLAHIESLGLRRIDSRLRSVIHDAVMEELDREFPPGSGKSFRSRMRALGTKHKSQVRRFLSGNYSAGNAAERITRDVKAGLAFSGKGRTPVKGGSMIRQSRRIMVSEETRLANEVERRTLQASGVAFAYWRLNPAHKWYGGREICEHFASRIVPETQQELDRLGIRVSASELEGLHLVADWPQYPHPYCKCYPEGWFPSRLQNIVEERGEALLTAGIISAEILVNAIKG